MSLDKELHSLGAVVDRLEQAGVDVSLEDLAEYDHRDTLRVTLTLGVPAALDVDDTSVGASDSTEVVDTGATTDEEESETDSPPEAESDEVGDDTDTTTSESPDSPTADDHTGDEGEYSLTPAQRDILTALADHGGEAPTPVLREDTGLGKAAYNHLNNLADAGLIERRPDPEDGRRTLAALSDDGATLVGLKDDVDDQDEPDEDQEVDVLAESDGDGNGGDLTVADVDWLDESSFHVAVAESADLQDLRETLGWRDEDGDLGGLVRGMDATDDLPAYQEVDT